MADNIVSTISAPVIASLNINPWPAVDPDYILSELKNLKAEFCPNNKVFWKSYGKWISMSNDKRDKSLSFFNNLTPAIQLVVNIILELISLLIIQTNILQVNNTALGAYNSVQIEANSNEAVTSKHDRCRLLHLFVRPEAIRLWNHAMTPLVKINNYYTIVL